MKGRQGQREKNKDTGITTTLMTKDTTQTEIDDSETFRCTRTEMKDKHKSKVLKTTHYQILTHMVYMQVYEMCKHLLSLLNYILLYYHLKYMLGTTMGMWGGVVNVTQIIQHGNVKKKFSETAVDVNKNIPPHPHIHSLIRSDSHSYTKHQSLISPLKCTKSVTLVIVLDIWDTVLATCARVFTA